jgi:hypothetical protein
MGFGSDETKNLGFTELGLYPTAIPQMPPEAIKKVLKN